MATFSWTMAAALAGALTTGVLHAAWLAWRLFVRGEMIWRPRDFPWMTPASYLAPLVVAAVLVWLLTLVIARWRPAFNTRRAVAWVILLLGIFALLLLVPRVHPVALLMLAAGVATAASASVSRLRTGQLWVAGATLACVVVAWGASERVTRTLRTDSVIASLRTPAEGRPNVLLIILDTVRAASLSLYGYAHSTTPALERWAKEGVTFEYAFSTAPWTLPSHGSLFTGRRAAELSTGEREPLDGAFPTLAEVFRDRGYLTAGFVSNVYYAGYDSGLDRGFAHYDDYQLTLAQVWWSSTLAQTNMMKSIAWSDGVRDVLRAVRTFDLSIELLRHAHRKRASVVTDDFLAWEKQREGRPYFAFLNYFDAHAAYIPPPEYLRRLREGASKRERYEACIQYLDDEIDRLFLELQRRGTLDNTIVVVTSDHGEYFGEHDLTGHGNGLHRPVIQVPLLLRYPQAVPAGERYADAVSIREIPGTLLALAGNADPRFSAPLLSRMWGAAPEEVRETRVEASNGHFDDAWLPRSRRRQSFAVLDEELHWIRMFDGAEQLFAYRTDSTESEDLADSPTHRHSLERLRRLADAERP